MLSSKSLNHAARTKTNWEASLMGPRLTFLLIFHFSAIRSSQRHNFVQSPTSKLITFLGGNSKGGAHIERRVQRDKRPRENTPTHAVCSILLFPALLDICLLCQERPRVCSTFLLLTQENTGVSRRNQGLQCDQWLTHHLHLLHFLTHMGQQQRPWPDFYGRSTKVQAEMEPPSTFRLRSPEAGDGRDSHLLPKSQ